MTDLDEQILKIVKANVSVSPSDAFYKQADINPRIIEQLRYATARAFYEAFEREQDIIDWGSFYDQAEALEAAKRAAGIEDKAE